MSTSPRAPERLPDDVQVTVLAGGVGGSKLVRGLAAVLRPDQLTVVVNTADDFTHLGLHVSPDLDTVVHRLAGLHDPDRGWGRADESWTVMEEVARLEGPDWFRLGDRDLATHLVRTDLLAGGATLAEVTARLCASWEVPTRVLPMTNDPVATWLDTAEGDLAFQEWFVRRRCEPAVRAVDFRGAAEARPAPGVVAALTRADVVVLAPSNPFLSIDPILAVPAIGAALRRRVAHDPIVAVSPIVGGRALRGPAASLLADLGLPVGAQGVAEHLAARLTAPDDLPGDGLGALVVDDGDEPVDVPGVASVPADIVMRDADDEARLAREVVATGLALASAGRHDVVTVVPVADGPRAKSRLGEVLDPAARRALATELAVGTVGAALQLGPVVVVLGSSSPDASPGSDGSSSPDASPRSDAGKDGGVAEPGDTAATAAEAGSGGVTDRDVPSVRAALEQVGAVVIDQSRPGLNAAVAQGIEWATRRSDVVLVVPADLPHVTPEALRAVVAEADAFDQGVVVAPDQRDDGTNALVLKAMPNVPPSYGPDSAQAHAAAARDIGVPVVVHRSAGLADLDTPADWHALDGGTGHSHDEAGA